MMKKVVAISALIGLAVIGSSLRAQELTLTLGCPMPDVSVDCATTPDGLDTAQVDGCYGESAETMSLCVANTDPTTGDILDTRQDPRTSWRDFCYSLAQLWCYGGPDGDEFPFQRDLVIQRHCGPGQFSNRTDLPAHACNAYWVTHLNQCVSTAMNTCMFGTW